MPRKWDVRLLSDLTEVKSKFYHDIHRFSISWQPHMNFEEFNNLLESKHQLYSVPYFITYVNNKGEVLPINNDDNFDHAIISTRPLLRIFVKKKGQSIYEINGFGCTEKPNFLTRIIADLDFKGSKSNIAEPSADPRHRLIGAPQNFRPVSSIIDVDILPHTQRRVKLMKGVTEEKPLGFFIRDGIVWKNPDSGGPPEKCRGIFISKLIPGGLAYSTGLLALNDEIIEVNGIDVAGKTLDQVTDMMVANALCLIITIKPADSSSNMRSLNAVPSDKPSLLQKIELSDEEEDSLTDYTNQYNAETLMARGNDSGLDATAENIEVAKMVERSFRSNGQGRGSNVNSINSKTDSGIFNADADLQNNKVGVDIITTVNDKSDKTHVISEMIDPMVTERKNGDGCYEDDDDIAPNHLMLTSWKDVHLDNLFSGNDSLQENSHPKSSLSQDSFSRNLRNNTSDQYLHQKSRNFGFAPRASDLAIRKPRNSSSGDRDLLLTKNDFGYL